ncbi:MAG TPA: hypothetical protein VHN74_20215 [Candidatus Angelobacter sp.]|jgi:hypothetical protein|nr:hypothetical protein [Candidatus Angelobacter sp.]
MKRTTPVNHPKAPFESRALNISEVRIVADLRVMHSKVDELYQIVTNLKRRHDEDSIKTYADREVLDEDIRRVDEIYLWFLALKAPARGLKIG